MQNNKNNLKSARDFQYATLRHVNEHSQNTGGTEVY